MNFIKINFYAFIIVNLIASSGSRDEQARQTSNDTYTSLIGKWQWVRTDGGFANNIHDTPSSIKENTDLIITANNKYFKTFNQCN